MNLIELPITGIAFRPKIKTELFFHGKVDSIRDTMIEIEQQYLNSNRNIEGQYTKELRARDILTDLIYYGQGRCWTINLGPSEEHIHYFVTDTETWPVFTLVAGHEEGHILKDRNSILLLEQVLLSRNVNIDLNNIENEEVVANFAGLYALDRDGVKFNSLPKRYLNIPTIKTAIELYDSHRIK